MDLFKTFKIKLVGCNFATPKKTPEVGDIIKVKLEPDNKVDKDAIMVINQDGEKIGYVGTNNTVSEGNKRNGCVDNITLKKLINFDNDDNYLGIITKFKEYFGFCDITVYVGD